MRTGGSFPTKHKNRMDVKQSIKVEFLTAAERVGDSGDSGLGGRQTFSELSDRSKRRRSMAENVFLFKLVHALSWHILLLT